LISKNRDSGRENDKEAQDHYKSLVFEFSACFGTNTREREAHGLCYHYSWRFLEKNKEKHLKTAILVVATLAILLSGMIPFLSTLIKWNSGGVV